MISGFSHTLTSAKGPLPAQMIPCDSKGQVHLPSEIKKVKNVIYGFFDSKEDKFYIGKTAADLQKRISQHNRSTAQGADAFHSEIQNRPYDFYFGVFDRAVNPSDLSNKEIANIVEYDSVDNGYNGNKGGGGGVSKDGCLSPVSAQRSEGLEGKDLSQITPLRYYPLRTNKKGNPEFLLTPTGKEATDVVYVIKGKDNQRYIGETGNTLARRASQHLHLAKKPKAKTSNDIYKKMREDPDSFSIGILHKCKKPRNAPGMERALIRAKRSLVKYGGYNKNPGGNGSFSQRIHEASLEENP